MKCPICNVDLQMTERQGVEIDYCPQCRGVWLDRGELDKIIEKSQAPVSQPMHHDSHPPRYAHDDRHDYHDGYGHGKRHKRESLLGELFDF